MVELVLKSMSKALHDKFGDDYHYYMESIEQKVKLNCFTLGVLNPINRSVNKEHYYRTVPCVLHYFPQDKTKTVETCLKVGEQALECLEYLNLNGLLVRGEDMSYTMVDDALQIFITYRFWTTKEQEAKIKMEDLAISQSSATQ